MIKTNLVQIEKDLFEIINLFTLPQGIQIEHCFTESNNEYLNQVIINGKAFFYSNVPPTISNNLEKKRYIKRYSKLSVYKSLVEYTNQSKPWGALTGVRPTKLAYQELHRSNDFKNLFKNEMLVSNEKFSLIENVVKNQQTVFDYKKVYEEKRVDLFVGIPFCPSRCKYCSFISSDISQTKKYLPNYVDCLVQEIESAKQITNNFSTVYVGGGTPVSIDNESLIRILKAINFKGKEFTVEAGRPDAITKNNLGILKDLGVNRICINPQTFNQKTLNSIGRFHSVDDIYEKYEMAKSDFIINMDLIAGLLGESFDDFKHSLEETIKLSPHNITVHTLCLKKGAELKEKGVSLIETEVYKMLEYTHTRLGEIGYKPYYLYRQKYMAGNLENVGYYKDEHICKYNVHTMEEVASTIACGAGGVSKYVEDINKKILRYGNPKDVLTYVNKIEEIKKEKQKFFMYKL